MVVVTFSEPLYPHFTQRSATWLDVQQIDERGWPAGVNIQRTGRNLGVAGFDRRGTARNARAIFGSTKPARARSRFEDKPKRRRPDCELVADSWGWSSEEP